MTLAEAAPAVDTEALRMLADDLLQQRRPAGGLTVALAADEIDRLRAAQAEWLPIESAPRNKAVAVYVPGLDYYGNRGVYAAMLADMGTGPHWLTFGWAIGRDLGPGEQPTHWRALPHPPAAGDRHE